MHTKQIMLVNQVSRPSFRLSFVSIGCKIIMKDVVSKETLLLPIHPKLIITSSSLVKSEMKDNIMREKGEGKI